MKEFVTAYLLLGSNLGDRAALLHEGLTQLTLTAGPILATSGIYETASWGLEDQPAFLNQAIALRTELPPEALLEKCLAAERHAGRERRERWGSRTLDIDILLFGEAVINQLYLTVPHPQLAMRRFALVPLADIAASLMHPQLGQTVNELLAACPDPLPVRRWTDIKQ